MDWEGDFAFVANWVRTLYPPPPGPLSLQGDDEENEEEEDEDDIVPSKIEIHAGTRGHVGPTGRELNCYDYEEVDVATQVGNQLRAYLSSLPADRTQIRIRLVAFRLDDDDEVQWDEKNANNHDMNVRVFTRKATQIAVGPGAAAAPPPRPVTDLMGAMSAVTSAAPPAGATSADPFFEKSLRPDPATGNLDPMSVLTGFFRMMIAGFEHREHAFSQREQVILGEHRYLIDSVVASNERTTQVLMEFARASQTETRANRDQVNRLTDNFRDAQVRAAEAARDAELVRATTEKGHLKQMIDQLQGQLNTAQTERARLAKVAAQTPEDASMSGQLTNRVANTAGTVLDAIVNSVVAGQPNVGGSGQQQNNGQQQQQNNGQQQNTAGGGGGLGDLLKDPSSLVFGLKMLSPEARKAAFAGAAKADPELFTMITDEIADAFDSVLDGVDDGSGTTEGA